MFDENGMLILKSKFTSEKKVSNYNRDRTKHVKYGSNVKKVRDCLSEYSVGDKIKVSDIRKKTGIPSVARALWILKMNGFIELEVSGKGKASYLTILRKI
ncbi:MAG: hypothetical protein AAE987_07245 [Thermoplasmataceae archaeon]|jgi:hypothetical protein